MTEIKLKIFITLVLGSVLIAALCESYEVVNNSIQIGNKSKRNAIKKEIDFLLKSGCIKLDEQIRINKEHNFVEADISNMIFSGNIYNLKLIDHFILKEINLENKENDLKIKAFLFVDQLTKSCLGTTL